LLTFSPGMSYTFTLTGWAGVVCSTTWVVNEAVVTADGPAPVTVGAGCMAVDSTPHVTVSSFWVNAATGTQSPAPERGSVVSYTVTIRNSGWSTAYAVEWIDTLPTLVSQVSYTTTPTGWTADLTTTGTGGQLLLKLNPASTTLFPGESATATFTAVVNSSEPGLFDVTNRVWATFTGPCGIPKMAIPGVARVPLTTQANETAVGPVKKDSSIVYPSPARGDKAFIAFYLDSAAIVKVRIYNQQGLLLDTVEEYKDAGPAQCPVSTGRLAPGIYYYTVEVNVPGGRTMHKPRKLVVAR